MGTLGGPVNVFLKRGDLSEEASESWWLITQRDLPGSKVENVIVKGCNWIKRG
jgi:hypothetical protein